MGQNITSLVGRGRATPASILPKGAEKAFLQRCVPEPNSGCWLWTSSVNSTGYGCFSMRPLLGILAHRAAWLLYRGDIPSGLFVCHRCDVRCCVNPDHLFLGTARENMRDCVAKGRFAALTGTKNGQSKLTDDAVRAIRQSTLPQRIAAKVFDIDPSTISRIRAGKRWSSVV